jgi:hypothetical protein
MFAVLCWLDRNDPDAFDAGTIISFLIVAAVSQGVALGLYYSKLLLNTFPHILSNVIGLVAIAIVILIIMVY